MEFQSKSEIISASLREMIITGQLEPNAPLRQRQLAAQFGVSPTPVREALRRLETEGLVHYDLHRGATVIGTSFGPSDENYWVRASLESFAARLAATRISDRELDELEALHNQIDTALRAGDEPGATAAHFHELNRQFHFAIYAASRSPLLLALLRLLWQSFPGGPPTVRSLPDSVDQHADILDALRRRDEAAAEWFTRQHILEAAGYVANADRQFVRPPDGAAPVGVTVTPPPPADLRR